MYKVAINGTYGGFILSQKAEELFLKKAGIKYIPVQKKDPMKPWQQFLFKIENRKDIPPYIKEIKIEGEDGVYFLNTYSIPRHNPLLIETIEELGTEESSFPDFSRIELKDVKTDKYLILEQDGKEKLITDEKSLDWVYIND